MNSKRVYRIYVEEKLIVRRRPRRRRVCAQARVLLAAPTCPNQTWTMDFLHDALANGRKLRTLSIEDAYTREMLAIEVDTSLPALRVIRVLETLPTFAQPRLRLRDQFAAKLKPECSRQPGLNEGGSSYLFTVTSLAHNQFSSPASREPQQADSPTSNRLSFWVLGSTGDSLIPPEPSRSKRRVPSRGFRK